MSEQEDFPISKGLVDFIEARTSSEFSMKRIHDAWSLDVIADRDMGTFTDIIDSYYSGKGFKMSEGSATGNKYAFRTYRHEEGGGSSSVMIVEMGHFVYNLFITDSENELATTRRMNATLAERLKGQNSAHN